MNHPTHPESVEFAGLVMGRESPTNPVPNGLANELIREMQENVAKYGRENCTTLLMIKAIKTLRQMSAILDANAQAAFAAPVAAQPETSNLALQELTTLIRHHTDPEAFQEIRQALLAFNQTAQPVQPAVPVTDAEHPVSAAGNPLVKRIHVCGVTCHQGDANCNGYCLGKADRAAEYFTLAPAPLIDAELPPLPKPSLLNAAIGYTAQQMREYALASRGQA